MNEFKSIIKTLKNNFKFYHIIFLIIFLLFNCLLNIFYSIMDRKCIEKVKVEHFVSNEKTLSEIKTFLLSPGNDIINFDIGKKTTEFEWDSMIKKIIIGIPKNNINEFEKTVITISDKKFIYNNNQFITEWTKYKNIKKLNNDNILYFSSPKNLFYKKTLIPYKKLYELINYKGELKIIKDNLFIIILVSLFFFIYGYIIYYTIIKILFKKIKFLELIKNQYIALLIIFSISSILIIFSYIFLSLQNKILIYFLLLSPFFYIIYLIFTQYNFINNKQKIDLKINKDKIKYIKFIVIILVVIILTGFSLRIIGIDHGFPQFLDSSVYCITDSSFNMLNNNKLDPNMFKRPNHISIIFNVIFYDIFSFFKFNQIDLQNYETHRVSYYLISRIFVALIGSLTILVGYFIGREFNKIYGILIAIIISIFPFFTHFSHDISPDIPLTMFIMLSILFAIRYLKYGNNSNLFFLILFSVFSSLEKYPGLISILLVISMIIIKNKENQNMFKLLLTSSLLFIILLFLISPFFIIRIYSVLTEFIQEANQSEIRTTSFVENITFYPQVFFNSTGIILFLFMIIGIAELIKEYKIISLPIFFGFIYYFLLSIIKVHAERWGLPMFISPLMISVFGIYYTIELIIRLNNKIKYLLIPIVIIISSISFCNLFFKSLVDTLDHTLIDTRYASQLYLEKNNIKKDKILEDGFSAINPSVRNKNFITLYNSTIFMKQIEYIMISSKAYSKFIYNNQYSEYQKVYKEIFNKKELGRFKQNTNYNTNSYLEINNIINGIKFIPFYLKNKNKLMRGPEIIIYKK